MDAITYLREKNRMTNKCSIFCGIYPLYLANNKRDMVCKDLEAEYSKEAVAIVESWSKANPPTIKRKKSSRYVPSYRRIMQDIHWDLPPQRINNRKENDL